MSNIKYSSCVIKKLFDYGVDAFYSVSNCFMNHHTKFENRRNSSRTPKLTKRAFSYGRTSGHESFIIPNLKIKGIALELLN